MDTTSLPGSKIKLCTKTNTCKPTQAQMHSSTTEDFPHMCGRNSQQKSKYEAEKRSEKPSQNLLQSFFLLYQPASLKS